MSFDQEEDDLSSECWRHGLFGDDESSSSSCGEEDEFIPRPIAIILVVDDDDTMVVTTLLSSSIENIKSTELAPSVCMAGRGVSIKLLQPNHSTTIKGTGGVVWGCAPALCTILSSEADLLFSNKVILELGSGTGALGLWIAARWPTATVILTDLEETMSNLRDNIYANNLGEQCNAKELIFGDAVTGACHRGSFDGGGHPVDVIVASDCQFSTMASFVWQPFVATLASAAVGTQVYISLQERYGTCKERLEPFLNALQELGRSADAGQQGTSFVELISQSPHKSTIADEGHPIRCFRLEIASQTAIAASSTDVNL